MALRRTKLLNVVSITGINTVGVLTVGVTNTGGPVGVASTTYIRGIIMHNTGLSTCASSVYIYPSTVASPVTGVAITNHRLVRVDLAASETFFFECNYPLVLTDRDKLVFEVSPGLIVGSGIGSVVNYQILGDTDI